MIAIRFYQICLKNPIICAKFYNNINIWIQILKWKANEGIIAKNNEWNPKMHEFISKYCTFSTQNYHPWGPFKCRCLQFPKMSHSCMKTGRRRTSSLESAVSEVWRERDEVESEQTDSLARGAGEGRRKTRAENKGESGDEERGRWGEAKQMRTVSAASLGMCVNSWRIIWPQRWNTHLTSHSTGGSTRGISNRQTGAYLNSEGEKIQDPIHTGAVIDADRQFRGKLTAWKSGGAFVWPHCDQRVGDISHMSR